MQVDICVDKVLLLEEGDGLVYRLAVASVYKLVKMYIKEKQ